jgi:hypothetical protein
MTRILTLFQIKTVRSAWVFFFGSALLVLFGAYQAATSPAYPSGDPRRDFDITFLSFWFVIGAVYMGIASWALFSEKGRRYLEAQEQIPIKGNRTILWYIKFLFACYAAALATMMFLGVLSLPFAGFAGLEAMFSPNIGLYLLVAGLVWSPLIFRYLK